MQKNDDNKNTADNLTAVHRMVMERILDTAIYHYRQQIYKTCVFGYQDNQDNEKKTDNGFVLLDQEKGKQDA